MHNLSTRFIVRILAILIVATVITIGINNRYIDSYYLHQKKQSLDALCTTFEDSIKKPDTSVTESIETLEQKHDIVIVATQSTNDNNMINDSLRTAFQEKGIGFKTYWLWEQDYQDTLSNGRKIRLYQQDTLNYSILVEYLQIDNQLYALAMIIPDITDAFVIINSFLIIVNVIVMLSATLVIAYLIKRITKPLSRFREFAANMEKQTFIPLQIETKDELQIAAESLNTMGYKIESYQKSLQEKNKQMENLLDAVAHDLKTPVALIKLYANGIKEGLDDDTFLETIIQQNNQMEHMISKLLFISSIEDSPLIYESIDFSNYLLTTIKEQQILAHEKNVRFYTNIAPTIHISSNRDWLHSIVSNLLTNAIKYTSNKDIRVVLYPENDTVILTISNPTDISASDLEHIWEPYYVGEKSRNKHLSGTGLGLSIVKKIADKLHYQIHCTLRDGRITFTLSIPYSNPQ